VPLGQVSLPVLRFSPAIIIPPRPRIYVLLISTNGCILGTVEQRQQVISSQQCSIQLRFKKAGIMAAETVTVLCSVCRSINLLQTTEAPFVIDRQQQHTKDATALTVGI